MSRPAVVFGGPSPEHDVSILTGLQAVRALASAGRSPHALYWSKSGSFHEVDPDAEADAFAAGVPRGSDPVELVVGPDGGFAQPGRMGKRKVLEISAVLNACHGGPGEDGTLQAALDLAGLRYTGPDRAGAALAMDKLAFRAVAAATGLPGLPLAVVAPDAPAPAFAGPYIVKPRFGGSSIGIEVVADWTTAQALCRTSPHLRHGAVAEPYLEGADDLEISVRTDGGLRLSPIARPLRTVGDGTILGYGDKYLGGEGMASTPRELPADIDEATEATVRDAANALVEPARLRSLVRIDFLAHDGSVFVNEINSIPGSLSLYLWAAAGDDKAAVVVALVDEAAAAPARAFPVEGADGSALRAAGSIASKLA